MKISIITATKNNKSGLMRAIESVRSQTYKNVEHIIVDGGSSDGSAEAIKNEQLKIKNYKTDESSRTNVSDLKDFSGASLLRNDKGQNDRPFDYAQDDRPFDSPDKSGQAASHRERQGDKSLFTNHYSLITISEADTGIYDAINKGIKLATGDVIGLLHSDDFFADEFVLERVAEVFQDKRLKEKDKSILSSRTEGFGLVEENRDQRTENGEKRSVDSMQIPNQVRDDIAKDDKKLTTDNLPPTIDAVYSDLVYVRGKTRDDKRTKNNSESNENTALNIEHSVIRTWKTHKTVSSEQSIVSREQRTADSRQSAVSNETTTYYSPLTIHHLLNGWMPPHPTLFVRKEVFEKYGLYRTDMKIAADYEMILRLFYKHKITAHYLPITTYCMTIGGASNKSLRNIITKSREDYRAMKMHSLPFPLRTLVLKNLSKIPQFFKSNK